MQPIEIRLLFESDIPSAMELKEAAGWNQTEADWRRVLSLAPSGCFAAVKDGRVVGTTTTTIYDELAWIGMVLVERQHRRQGIAAQLMNVALDYLSAKVKTIKLDATALGQPVYERFGFEVESEVERWTGAATGSEVDSPSPMNHEAVLTLDRLAFGADRSQLLEKLIDDACVPPVLITGGYALARAGTRKTYIGPVIANDAQVIEPLLDRMLSRLAGRDVYIDINKECIVDTSVLSARGFVKERDLVRMVKGGPARKTSPLVVAIAGPEVG